MIEQDKDIGNFGRPSLKQYNSLAMLESFIDRSECALYITYVRYE